MQRHIFPRPPELKVDSIWLSLSDQGKGEMVVSWLLPVRGWSSEVANTLSLQNIMSSAHSNHLAGERRKFEQSDYLATYLDKLIPATGHNHWVLGVGAEADTRNPLSVSLFGDGVFAVAEGVPELDCAITRSGDDLTVVGREGYG